MYAITKLLLDVYLGFSCNNMVFLFIISALNKLLKKGNKYQQLGKSCLRRSTQPGAILAHIKLRRISTGSKDDPIDGKEDEYVWLEEIETPDDLYMRQGRYAGPPIQI